MADGPENIAVSVRKRANHSTLGICNLLVFPRDVLQHVCFGALGFAWR